MNTFKTMMNVSTAVLLMVSVCAGAQPLTDPTRPPAAGFTGVDASAATDPGGLVLQSVMLSSARRSAIISGERVELGGRIADATLVQISEHEVTLKGASGTQVLKMYPGVEKQSSVREVKPVAAAAPTKRAGRPAGGAAKQ
jgi:hypothetical protein